MSWSFGLTAAASEPSEEFEERLRDTWANTPRAEGAPDAEIEEQVEAAIKAASALAKTVHPQMETCCSQAGPCCTVNVFLSGHATPGHSQGDTVSISIQPHVPGSE